MGKKYVYLIIGIIFIVILYFIFFNRSDNTKYIDINSINLSIVGNETEYYFTNTYMDKGAIARQNSEDYSNLIIIDSNVNPSIPGEYVVTYKIDIEENHIEKKRQVIIEDLDIEKAFDTERNKINLNIKNNGYSYTIMPDGIKETSREIDYTYKNKDNYEFIIYLNSGSSISYSVNMSNTDLTSPIATCTSKLNSNNNYTITVDATDESGIKKYQYNKEDFISNVFNIVSNTSEIKIKVYDKENNVSEILCKNVSDTGFKNIKSKNEKLGYAKCNTDVNNANIELENIIKSYGERTRSAVVAAAVFLANYNYSISYQWGGKYLKKGINPEWGCSKHTQEHNGRLVCTKQTGSDTCEAGLDCTGYTSWAFFQAGFDKSILRTSSQSTGMWGSFNASKHKYAFSSNNLAIANQIKPGDLVWREGHVGIVIGVSDDELQIANEIGPIIVQTNKKINGVGTSGQAAFTHFVLFDEFYNMYGSNT